MAYWWVSQNKTYVEEHDGGYLWAPKQDAAGLVPHHWQNMSAVAVGDIVFSYVGQRITAVAIAKTAAYDAPMPFKNLAGQDWSKDGRRIDVAYDFVDPPLVVALIVGTLRPLLPSKYSPLTEGGTGNQGYLFALPAPAGEFLLDQLQRPSPPQPAPPIVHPHATGGIDQAWRKKRVVGGVDSAGRLSQGINRRSRTAKLIGDRAESAVVEWLRQTLPRDERDSVTWVASEGTQPGWDVEYISQGRRVAIEVKGTTASSFPAVEITANEWEAARTQREDYWLYLVTNCMTSTPVITRIHGPYGLYEQEKVVATPLIWRLERIG